MAHIGDLHKQTFPESPVAMSNLIMFEGPVEAVRTFSRFGDNFLLFVKKDVVRRSWRLFVKIVGGEKNADKYKAVIDVEEVTTDRNHHHRFVGDVLPLDLPWYKIPQQSQFSVPFAEIEDVTDNF